MDFDSIDMSSEIKKIYELIRTQVLIAVAEELRIDSFNLSGNGHEPRVTLNRRLAAVLKGQNIPSVYISGFGTNRHYPLRVFLRAEKSIKQLLPNSPFTIYSGVAYLSKPVILPTRQKRLIPITARNSRDELLRRGWSMRGAWAEKSISQTRLVLSGRFEVEGVPHVSLSFHPSFSVNDALVQAKYNLAAILATKARATKAKPKKLDFDFLDFDQEYGAGFFASLMDGPSVDLFKIAGFKRNSELLDTIWDHYNWQSLLEECRSVEIIETGENDEAPGMSDVFFWVAIDDPKKFKKELRTIILAAIKSK
ncbi:hypothetical protein [Polynucleobacter kasalickyi]|uniref:Uncharacterized protein n=1 Tax=Polynucleobacter kasalickyi TaxID=1938817 RepID=A0A1W2CCJ7_9BURK|nr:hypothetical protein [Polynucleobacter kasalickyi]SMC82987.1 hypothetical protein SAMN06296008_12215 [Polynucleobacter kasalickyi]